MRPSSRSGTALSSTQSGGSPWVAGKRIGLHAGAWALSSLLLATAAFGDDVFLKNGNVFEGVVARDLGEHVIVEFGTGSMKLPKSRVLRIEERLTTAQEFEQRQDDLMESSAEPSAWLELARWARSNDMHADYKRIVLEVADMAPELDGLDPLMRRFGYVPDATDGWIRESTLKRRQGLVYHGGDWVTPEQKTVALEIERLEQQTRLAAQEERRREEELDRKLARLERLEREAAEKDRRKSDDPSDNEVALAQIDLMKEVLDTVDRKAVDRRPNELLPRGGFLLPSVPAYGAFVRRGPVRVQRDDTWQIMSVRQPGSLITVDQFRGTTPKQ